MYYRCYCLSLSLVANYILNILYLCYDLYIILLWFIPFDYYINIIKENIKHKTLMPYNHVCFFRTITGHHFYKSLKL